MHTNSPTVGTLFILLSHTDQYTKAVLNRIRHRLQTTATDVFHINPHLELELLQLGFDLQAQIPTGSIVADHDVLSQIGGDNELLHGAFEELSGVTWQG